MEAADGSGAASGSDCEMEDPEPESSEAGEEALDELTAFREQWQRELSLGAAGKRKAIDEGQPRPEEELTDEDKAKQLFLRGVEYERSGKLYEAIQQYKRAMQLEPDVESRLYHSAEQRDSPEVDVESEAVEETSRLSDDEDAVEGEELLARLQRIINRKGRLCEPELPAKGTHISALPAEVVQLILRWVVGAELDVMSLERVSASSRGLYIAAREPALWRDICRRTWGADCGSPLALGLPSWRHMVTERPRVHPHGCYISKTTYLRHGETSFQDHCYRPWYLVDYYRYLRFFPDGFVLMWTTPEEPAGCVGQLRSRAGRAAGLMAGHWRLIGEQVVVVVKKCAEKKAVASGNTRFRARRKEGADSHEQTFHCEFQLRRVRSRRNQQLVWVRYSARSARLGGDDQWTHFELQPQRFPPFHFSRVAAYTAESAAPL